MTTFLNHDTLELAYELEQDGKQVCEWVQHGKLEQVRELEHAQCWQLHELKCLHGQWPKLLRERRRTAK